VAGLDSVIPVMVLVFLFGVQHGRTFLRIQTHAWLSALGWFGYATLLGIVLGLLFVFLMHRVRERAHLLLISIGFLIFSGGLAMALGFPPLYVNFVAGVMLVNLMGHHNRIWEIASASERPFYFILLVLVGAAWHLGNPWALILAPLFFLARILAKCLSLWLAGRIFFGSHVLNWRNGLALSGQGATAVALAASVQLVERGTLADSALTMILGAVLLSGLFAPGLTSLGLNRGARR
jgi:Kef-type K+ transport system membrane component KefB